MNGHGEVIAFAHHRPALPTGALVAAGEQPVVCGRHPNVTGNVERAHRTLELDDRSLNLLFDVDACAGVRLSDGLGDGVDDGVARLPGGRRGLRKSRTICGDRGGRGVRAAGWWRRIAPTRGVEDKDAVAGARDHGSIFGLRQGKDVAAIEARAQLLPVRAAVSGTEHAAEVLVVDDAGIQALGMLAVHQQGRDLALGEPLVRRGKCGAAVLACQHAASIGGKQHAG